ncbi:MAG: hypothetical protein ACOY5C_08005 [Pseudomonadota bacterium]
MSASKDIFQDVERTMASPEEVAETLGGAAIAEEPTPEQIVLTAIQAATEDPGAPFEAPVVEALQAIRADDPAQFQRLRHQIKKANRDVRITELDRLVRGGSDSEREADGIVDQLVSLIRGQAELFHDAGGDCYARFQHRDHWETWALGSKGFAEWAGFVFYTETGKAPRDATLKDAIGTLSGIAKHEGPCHEVHLRVAKLHDCYYLDLADEAWRCIAIDATGWRILAEPPVRFRRTHTMRPLPEPKTPGNLDLLWQSINVPEADRPLVLAWLLDCLRPDTQFPILELLGEQGSGKSDTQSRLRDLLDPNRVNLRAAPTSDEDVFVGAHNNWLTSFNNLSRLTPAMQDALCSLSTGGGFARRTLYTNAEETLMDVTRPVVLNGITPLATAQDLLDRTIRLNLPRIQTRRQESELAAEFETNQATILAGLLDLFAATLRVLPTISLEPLPRMADFAMLGEAMFKALGRAGSFAELYQHRREQAVIEGLESSPVACAVQDYMERHPAGFMGTVKQLFTALEQYRQDGEAWPKSPRGLGDLLRRNAPGLRVAGIGVQWDDTRPGGRHRDGVHVILRHIPRAPEKADAPKHVHNVHNMHANKPDLVRPRELREHGEHRSGDAVLSARGHISPPEVNRMDLEVIEL